MIRLVHLYSNVSDPFEMVVILGGYKIGYGSFCLILILLQITIFICPKTMEEEIDLVA